VPLEGQGETKAIHQEQDTRGKTIETNRFEFKPGSEQARGSRGCSGGGDWGFSRRAGGLQHLDPKHESMLTELISRSTRMPVLEVKDGMGVAPDHVYVIPPNTTMTIHDHTLRLTAREETRGLHMAVDYFMRSLAEAQGHNAIGVILSGSGTDGTLGLAEIQAQGGVTFAQDETTARHDGMPRSAVAAGCVDFVLPPSEIARELTRIASHPYIAPTGKDTAADLVPEEHVGLNTIFQLIRKSTGVDFTHYRHTTIRRRVQRRMIVHKMDTLPRYVKYLQQNPAELKALYQDMLINVTSFSVITRSSRP
jgi:two-component system, chemotaxis family, CheB/CheR fusion protein